MAFNLFSKKKKDSSINIRVSTRDRRFMKMEHISPTKLFDEGLKVKKKEHKKNKLDKKLEKIYDSQSQRRKKKHGRESQRNPKLSK